MNTRNAVAVSSVITVGIFASVLFAAALAISPSLALLDASNFTLVKQAQIRILQVAMSSISTVYTVLAIWLLVLERANRRGSVFKLTLGALVLVIGALLYSAVTDIPYNAQILSWNPAAPPPAWASVRDAWDFANRVRTVPALLGFVLQTIALRCLEPARPA